MLQSMWARRLASIDTDHVSIGRYINSASDRAKVTCIVDDVIIETKVQPSQSKFHIYVFPIGRIRFVTTYASQHLLFHEHTGELHYILK